MKIIIPAKYYVLILSILLGLFCFRVIFQLLQFFYDLPFLPAFDVWQSGAVPYKALLITQILVIVFYGWIFWRIASNRMQPSRKKAWIFLLVGLLYFFSMLFRLVVGIAGLSDHYWFHSYLPIFFHFALASYLIVVGLFHFQTENHRL